jgi:Lar family restriction alleviation protein
MNEKLKPCPFCGVSADDTDEGSPMLVIETEDCSDRWYVHCDGCGASSGYVDSEVMAIVSWNTRV